MPVERQKHKNMAVFCGLYLYKVGVLWDASKSIPFKKR